jgi:hypothetical protein
MKIKVNDTSNLMDSIKRINRDEIEKEKAIQNREFCQESAKIRTRAAPNLIYIENW